MKIDEIFNVVASDDTVICQLKSIIVTVLHVSMVERPILGRCTAAQALRTILDTQNVDGNSSIYGDGSASDSEDSI